MQIVVEFEFFIQHLRITNMENSIADMTERVKGVETETKTNERAYVRSLLESKVSE